MRSPLIFLVLFLSVSISSCDSRIDLYEKVVSIPGHEWEKEYQPEFRFMIEDTTVPYNIFLILRHTEEYNFNNIWVNFYTQVPGDTVNSILYEARLADNNRWLGSGMDDLYDHRIRLTRENSYYFRKDGEYVFRIGHNMRENPLKHVMNVGLRIEKGIQ
jgi:gliding motility-associated lipoprotein GldH